MTDVKTKTIKLDYLARVEGEGALYLKIRDQDVLEARLKIFEPPRFFEGFLRGRSYTEAPDITARICGICPVAYQMSSLQAIEDACDFTPNAELKALRRLLYCGEWIESHGLHVFMLHAPDFLGYADAIKMAKDYRKEVERGLRLKKAGNAIVNLIGGREIHPINVKVGGFYRALTKAQLEPLVSELEWAKQAAVDTIRWCAGFEFPEFETDYEYVCLKHPTEYPMNEGRICSNKGIDITASEYETVFEEEHVAHSTALHSVIKSRGAYLTGPMARFNLNYDNLSSLAKKVCGEIGLKSPCNNPFKSILIRGIEILYACEEALRIIESYDSPSPASHQVNPKAATGYGATEAPRGLLYHSYQIDESGSIQDAKIVAPTSQNQKMIELDLVNLISKTDIGKLPKDELTWRCEQAVRNYDPCISCSAHFLKVDLDRE